jgi:predicted metalloprotease with PDZ domain
MRSIFLFIFITGVGSAFAQNEYRYSVDLSRIEGDALSVELLAPAINKPTAVFSIPKIIPGTYSIADYGKFISNVRAFDKGGKALTVTKQNENQWKISNANKLHKLTYRVDDIFDTDLKHNIYPMAATNIEEGKNVVLNLPGVFGFFEGYRQMPFQVSFEKPQQFYASTSLQSVSSTATRDVFRTQNVDELYDHPIMYSAPDTASVSVGNCQVLVSVYSPNRMMNAKEVAGWMNELLEAARKYLGGKLPAEKYAFIYYFKDPKLTHNFPKGLGGALEHTTSSFYYLGEAPADQLRDLIIDISSHEFFHIITPLTIASREVKEFNYNEAVLSKHLWLYEGVTEYTSHHVQVKYGLNPVQQFLDKLSQKITISRTQFTDTLSFTEMSVHSAGKHASQYGNVYQKGALIAACLDVYLLHLSNGNYGLRNLTYDLGVRFGRNRYFNDDELFDHIAELSYPQAKEFLQKHVAGNVPIPYDYYFGLAGVAFTPKLEKQTFSFGNISMAPNAKGVIALQQPFAPNEFGQKMGYKAGDEIYSFQGIPVTVNNLNQVINEVKAKMKEGDMLVVKVGRLNNSKTIDTLTLSAPIQKITITELNKLGLLPNATAQQQMVQKAWLTAIKSDEPVERPAASAADVASIDAIVKATYNVISGAAGPRDWDRFKSLFLPNAQMGAVVRTPSGEQKFFTLTPESYQKSNASFFQQSGFFEEELNRKVMQFGNVATVQSAYQFRMSPAGKVEQRGVNYITLVKTDGRWWISNLVWQEEEKDLPLPAELLKK